MTYKRDLNLSTIEIAELYLSGNYEFPLLQKNEPYIDIKLLRKLKKGAGIDSFVKPASEFTLFASQKTHNLSQAILETLEELEDEPNPDEILRQEGFYDSTDKRCCINRSRR